ncbi:hypothetical protein F5890DRAFT_1422530, partial [Lentinula detonsa]
GASPYFLSHGVHPLLPLDVEEATFLLPPPTSVLTTTDLLARRAQELQKRVSDLEAMRLRVTSNRLEWIRKQSLKYERSIVDHNFQPGALVLARNTRIAKTFTAKNHMRYMGPLIVIRRNRGGAYIVAELDGTVWWSPVGAFRLIPYLARTSLPLPNLNDFLDISTHDLREMEQSSETELPDFEIEGAD